MSDADKRAAAEAAVAEVRAGMLVGLGTGSTAYWAIEAVGRRVAAGEDIRAVATSEASAAQAARLGIPLLPMEAVAAVDLTIDGADEIDDRLFAVKGAGGAMVREKIVAAASRRMVVIADGTKRVERIGVAAVPVEVLPFAARFVAARLEAMDASAQTRREAEAEGGGGGAGAGGGEGAYRTDNGNLVLDARFGAMPDPRVLAAALDALPGVVGHGLFLDEVACAYLAEGGVVTKLERTRGDA